MLDVHFAYERDTVRGGEWENPRLAETLKVRNPSPRLFGKKFRDSKK